MNKYERDFKIGYEDASRKIVKDKYFQVIMKAGQLLEQVIHNRKALSKVKQTDSVKGLELAYEFLRRLYAHRIEYENVDKDVVGGNDFNKLKECIRNFTKLISYLRTALRGISNVNHSHKNVHKKDNLNRQHQNSTKDTTTSVRSNHKCKIGSMKVDGTEIPDFSKWPEYKKKYREYKKHNKKNR